MITDTGQWQALVDERDYLRSELAAARSGVARLADVVQELAEAISGPRRPVPTAAAGRSRERSRSARHAASRAALTVVRDAAR